MKKIFLLFIIAVSFGSVNADLYIPENDSPFRNHSSNRNSENDYLPTLFLVIGIVGILGIFAFIRKEQIKNDK